MFSKNTVLVLGAGASCHYGYPTGERLIDKILYNIKQRNFSYKGIGDDRKKPLYDQQEHYKSLYDQLEFYDPLSIDSFLSQFLEQKMVDAGKVMIAYEILESEN